jgi:hypothetical protein
MRFVAADAEAKKMAMEGFNNECYCNGAETQAMRG